MLGAAVGHNPQAKYLHKITSLASRGTRNWVCRHENLAKKRFNFDLKNT
jgi:hypothetical protein